MLQERKCKLEGKQVRKTTRWNLNDKELKNIFVGKVQLTINAQPGKTWEVCSKKLRSTAKEVPAVTSERPGMKKETWSWCAEVQDALKLKTEGQRRRDMNRYGEAFANYKFAIKAAKKAKKLGMKY